MAWSLIWTCPEIESRSEMEILIAYIYIIIFLNNTLPMSTMLGEIWNAEPDSIHSYIWWSLDSITKLLYSKLKLYLYWVRLTSILYKRFLFLLQQVRKMSNPVARGKRMWKLSANHARSTQRDIWASVNNLPVEKVKRYRYSPRKGIWTEDEIEIKIEQEVSGD